MPAGYKSIINPGDTFNFWVVIRDAPSRPMKRGSQRYVVCRCRCGLEGERELRSIRTGTSKSCGRCGTRNPRRTHGASHTGEYSSWTAMKQRVTNPKNPRFHRYGGRGIKVCERWSRFENFLADMGNKPSPAHTIERINGNKDYSPDNCRWATRAEQAQNTSQNRFLTSNGRTLCLAEWARVKGLTFDTLRGRIRRGWSVERSLATP